MSFEFYTKKNEEQTAGFQKPSYTGATPTVVSKPEGEREVRPFSSSFLKLPPGHAVFVVVNTRDISVPHPLEDHSQQAVQLSAPATRLCLESVATSPLGSCVVFAKNSTSESS
ncbi:hypothetical protein MRX96_030900 [Rhipicephalus microplus]